MDVVDVDWKWRMLLDGLADQVGGAGAGQVDGSLPAVQRVEGGDADGAFRASAGRQQLDHLDAVAHPSERQTRPSFMIQRFHIGVMLKQKIRKLVQNSGRKHFFFVRG